MRTLTAAARAKAIGNGNDPTVIVAINWDSWRRYSDHDVADPGVTAEGRIRNLSEIRSQIAQGKSGAVGSVSVELIDNDQTLLTRMASHRLEACTVHIWQHFAGLSSDDLLLLVSGKVGSPVVWEQDTRVLKFDVVSAIDSESFPYTPDDTDPVPEEAVGNTWPGCFGIPLDVPAAVLERPAQGHLTTEVFIQTNEFEIEMDHGEFTTGETTLQIGNERMTGTLTVIREEPTLVYRFVVTARNVSKGIVRSLDRDIIQDEYELDPAFGAQVNTLTSQDPRVAAWDDTVDPLVGNWLLLKSLGGIETTPIRVAEFLPTGASAPTLIPVEFTGPRNYILWQKGRVTRGQLPWWGPSGLLYIDINYEADVRGYLPGSFIYHAAGTPVTQPGQDGKFVCNALPSERVIVVKAYKDVKLDERGGKIRKLVRIPESYYSVNLDETVAGHHVTTLTFATPLEERGTGWDSQVYVTLESTVGPNTADVIQYLLENYTNLSVDAASFAAVETALEKYPSDFAVLKEEDALELCNRIAEEARCRLIVINGTAYLKYMSAQPSTFAGSYGVEDNLKEEVLQVGASDTDDILNDITYRYWRSYADEEPQVCHRVNESSIALFGTREEEKELLIYQRRSLVVKTLTFDLARKSRVWRRVRLTTWTEGLESELLDYVRAALNLPVFPSYVTCLIEDLSHETALPPNITFDCWTPVEAGTSTHSSDAWLDDSGDPELGAPEIDLAEEDVIESIETSPLDLSPTSPGTFVGQALIDEEDGVFDASLYVTGNNTGSVKQEQVQVRNLSSQQVKQNDVVVVHQAEDGTYFATKGSDLPIFMGVVGANPGSTQFTADLFEVGTSTSTLVMGAAVVRLFGDTVLQQNDVVTVYTAPDGTFWSNGAAQSNVAFARVTGDTADEAAVPCRVYYTTDFSGSGDGNIIVKFPALSSSVKIPAGTWVLVARQRDGNWAGYLPLMRTRVPA